MLTLAHAPPFAGGAQKRYWIFSVAVTCALCGLVDCNPTTPAAPFNASELRDEVVYVISGGWHTEIGLPVAEINGPLAALKPEFPTAQYLVFGWGAHDYYMVRNPGIGDLLRAAAPGPAVMLVIPLQVSPEAFFGASNAFAVPASRVGMERLSQVLWNYLAVEKEGHPLRVATGPYPRSFFYTSTGTYDLGHTCNTWTAEALRVCWLAREHSRRRFRGSGARSAPAAFGASIGQPERALTSCWVP